MRVITVIQPWATLIALGEKRFETRSWQTKHRGSLAIHAGKKIDREACLRDPIRSTLEKHEYTTDNLPTGAIIAIAELKDSHTIFETVDNGTHIIRNSNVEWIHGFEKSFGWYAEGRHAWELADVKKIDPIPAKGQQGFWHYAGLDAAR